MADPPVKKMRVTLWITFTLPERFLQSFEEAFMQWMVAAMSVFKVNYNIIEHKVEEIK